MAELVSDPDKVVSIPPEKPLPIQLHNLFQTGVIAEYEPIRPKKPPAYRVVVEWRFKYQKLFLPTAGVFLVYNTWHDALPRERPPIGEMFCTGIGAIFIFCGVINLLVTIGRFKD